MSAVEELMATIADRKIRRKVQKLLQLGEEAVVALGELDSALYLRENGEEQLQIVADAVLSHFRRLLEYVVMVTPAGEATTAPELVGPQRTRTDDERWDALAREMTTFQYGLRFELKEFERRFAHALASDNVEQAVRDLNDATTGLMDGVFAVLTTVYECFLGYAEPERMVPGHRDSLGKALAVRQALAILRREVSALNRSVQDRGPEAAASYLRIVEAMTSFADSEVFAYLRSDTRRDFWQFCETMADGDAVRHRLDCEGFDKYLDSLSFVSQRGVLIKHDTDLKAKAAAELERAIKFATVLPEVVGEAIGEAFAKAERLAGLSDELDAVVAEWSSDVDVDGAVALGKRLLELVRVAPRATTASDVDSF